jgi:hypothetical protein
MGFLPLYDRTAKSYMISSSLSMNAFTTKIKGLLSANAEITSQIGGDRVVPQGQDLVWLYANGLQSQASTKWNAAWTVSGF